MVYDNWLSSQTKKLDHTMQKMNSRKINDLNLSINSFSKYILSTSYVP